MAKVCEDFEVDCERRAHGALPPEQERALDEHLAGCERCRAFAGLVDEVGERLRSAAAEASQQAPWPVIEARLAERARAMRRSGWLVPAGLLGCAAAAAALGLPPGGALLMAAGALLTTALARRLRARWLRELAQAEASREGLLAFSRKQVDDELRAAQRAAAALSALAVVQVAVIEALGRAPAGSRAAVVGGALMLLVTAAALALRTIPRLRREREELR